MRSRLAVVLLALGLGLGQVSAHPDRPPLDRTVLDPVEHEVDFSPMAGAPAGKYPWRVTVTLVYQGGEQETIPFGGGGGPISARYLGVIVTEVLSDRYARRPRRVESRLSPSGERVAFRSCVGAPLRSVAVDAEGLPKSCRPRAYKVVRAGR